MVPSLKTPEGELDDADHQGQQQGQADVFLGERHRQRGDGGGGHQGDDGHRPGGQLPRRTPQGAQNGRHEGDIEAEIDRQAGQLRVGHGLGHQHQRAGDAGDQVAAQDDRIDREPGEKGKKTQAAKGCSSWFDDPRRGRAERPSEDGRPVVAAIIA